ncbi:TetR family transcriptional regulator [Arthrobacter sp. ISL-85]|uniref:TetR/AcrR family transcriptional regulator n=1 Tax=Arthrobacter sp. ISL-85 TaxID=2819115 RepID=UPI001BEB09A5|nr:TetR family transcriptional regulator [Arthrobacter sp. ISL-85]MBT2565754.1 TetR family transcriptional regulator [Arthrobacter sp. ISL-85]
MRPPDPPGGSPRPDDTATARRGRRSGTPGSREDILDAARMLFAEHGFEGTSMRQVARAAGVDPGMIHHFFTGKDELFALSVELPADPEQVLAGVAEADPATRAELIVRTVLRLWESPAQAGLLAFLRGTIGSKAKTALLREMVARRVISRIMASVPGNPDEVALRGSLVATQVVGLMMVRYVVRLEPLASAEPEDVVRLVAPSVQRYLTGPLA